MAQDKGLLINSKHKFKLDITPDAETRTLERLAVGFSSFDPNMNEETDQTKYLNGGGLGTTTVMGGQLTISFSGHRYFGDPVQDWIFSKQLQVGTERESFFEWTQPDGTVVEGPVTIAAITGPGGDAGAKGDITVEVHYNGEPTIKTVTP
ncbi:capsid protein [Bacillus spizizenii]|nr:capsid protein [Bacillus spizizenii]MCY8907075.1 capsid protein [Bacillus spizizenii]